MMRSRLLQPLRLMLLALVTLALLATGFAHRAPSQDEAALETLWVMAGGSDAGLCGASWDPSKPHMKCPACQLTGSVDVPPCMGAVQKAELRLLAELTLPPSGAPRPAVLDKGHGSRGPPWA
ncbi:hypothetical protein Q9295_02550 [Xinfangfangia sp. CPCC 101601]|uniref:DUF2946 domain-containing protein n=1 Tax=Pseudogemmobacter lacusdianii TaxID=3069608 RepID=A0ABU0VU33_9RHOB|nr:hypothetical protein [Xinfangfangia sp. CPCC 101601]MDQ2065241.1 hypothetical protein [Xinfangfangia sp. CPCC 101601]